MRRRKELGILFAEKDRFMKDSCRKAFWLMLGLMAFSCTKAQYIQSYSERLSELWDNRSESLPMAVESYREMVSPGDVQAADSAYVLLEDFAVLLTRNIDFNLILLQSGNSDRNHREKQAAADYERLLYSHYFLVTHKDGLIHVKPDLWRIQKELKDFLSPRTYSYFLAVQQDTNRNGDSRIVEFSPGEIARRALFWDGFLSDSTRFLFREEAQQRLEAYLEQLVFGSEQHPVFGKDGKLNEDYRQAYRKVIQEGGQGRVARVVADYLKLIEENGSRDCPAVWMFRY